MLHLHTERLAELVDEPASAEELAHLAQCSFCAEERRSFLALRTLAAGELESFGLPLTRWDAISAALAADAPRVAAPQFQRRPMPRGMQIAAGLLLVAGGATLGRMSARVAPASASFASDTVSRTVASGSADASFFSGVDDARARQQHAEVVYQQAAAYLARYDTTGTAVSSSGPVATRARLSALDQVISTTRAAMREAPHDPVINGYYLTTLGQREATLQQLNTVLPSSLHVNSF